MKKLVIPACVALMAVFSAQTSKAQETSKGLIVSTSSQAEVDKILATLKNEDPSTYRLTVSTKGKNGRVSNKVYGTAPLGSMTKIGGSTIGRGGSVAASDIIILVKNITKGKDIQDAVISQLNTNLTKQSLKTVQVNHSFRVLN
ncbi:hypothetical protein [Pedobacter sp. JY14-1]|uniref:hypothetical protein n=1 Tax=Pedobacter sp. JY14-1 TaxID=3034151 RepID=UPI0023E17767|nr:hypothetical protein [Pedobacter sp. JY14-1]